MKFGYSVKEINEHMARAVGRDMPISSKIAYEMCNFLRKKELQKAKSQLKLIIDKKMALPLKRFNADIGHKPGNVASGRYPLKASTHVLKLLESAEANAQLKGLNTGSLVIKTIVSNKASSQMRYGRQRGRETKTTHIEVIVEETKKSEKKTEKPKTQKTVAQNTAVEQKPAVKQKSADQKPVQKPAAPKPAPAQPAAKPEDTAGQKTADSQGSVEQKPAVEQKSVDQKPELRPKEVQQK